MWSDYLSLESNGQKKNWNNALPWQLNQHTTQFEAHYLMQWKSNSCFCGRLGFLLRDWGLSLKWGQGACFNLENIIRGGRTWETITSGGFLFHPLGSVICRYALVDSFSSPQQPAQPPCFPSLFPSPSKVVFCPGQRMRWIGWSRDPKGNTFCRVTSSL